MTQVLVSEEITPIRVCLLHLVSLYASRQVPEQLCPSLLTVVIRFLENESVLDTEGNLLLFPGLMQLLDQIDEAAKRSGFDSDSSTLKLLLLQELWSIRSVDDMDAKIHQVEHFLLLKHTIITSDSHGEKPRVISPWLILGGFIQRMSTTYKLLQFDEVFLFFDAFVSFRAGSRSLYVALGGQPPVGTTNEADSKMLDHLASRMGQTLAASNEGSESIVALSGSATRALLEKQVLLLETYGGLVPDSMRQVLRAMVQQDQGSSALSLVFSQTPSYYYAKYLENLHQSNYHGALDSLHQYFDYMVSNNSKYFYHFALISRASLHQYFGEFHQALDAIEEAISVARENKDNSTLTFILSWLYNLMKRQPELWHEQTFYHNNNAQHLLDFLVIKSQSVSPLLHCMSFLYETSHIMDSGGALGRYLESLVKAGFLALNDTKPSHIRALDMSATVWARVGQSQLADMYVTLAYSSARQTRKLSDRASMEIRRSFLEISSSDGEKCLEALLKLQQEISGKDQALENMLRVRLTMLQIELHLRNGRLLQARMLGNDLASTESHDGDVEVELVYLRARNEMEAKNYNEALSVVSSYLATSTDLGHSDVSLHGILRLKLLQCKIYIDTGNPLRAFSMLASQLVRARNVGFLSIVNEGVVLLASAQSALGGYKDGYLILAASMPRILAANNTELAANAYLELAGACYGMAREEDYSLLKAKDVFNLFLRYANAAINGFKDLKYPRKLLQCFQLEQKMANMKANAELVQHSQRAIQKIHLQLLEEAVKQVV